MHTSEQASNPDYQNSVRSTSTRPTLQLIKKYGLKIKKNCVQFCLSITLLLQNNSALENRPPESNLQSQYSLLDSSRTTTKKRNKDKWGQAINSALRSPLELLNFPWCPMSIRSFHLDPGPSWKRAKSFSEWTWNFSASCFFISIADSTAFPYYLHLMLTCDL